MVCSEAIKLLAFIGGIALYLLVGLVVAILVKELLKEGRGRQSDKETMIILGGVFWPITLVVLVVLLIARIVINIVYGATVFDLRDTESRLGRRIDDVKDECGACTTSVAVAYVAGVPEPQFDLWDAEEVASVVQPFKVGDVVTGRVPQTDKDGNVIGYKCLYTGCKCRVLSIDEKGSMSLLLLAHKDGVAHQSKIGNTFKAPARNFVLLAKRKTKKRVAKKKARKSKKKTVKKAKKKARR